MPLDFLTFAMPFFFVLVIVYGALEVSGVFKNRGVKGVISIIIAYFAITSEMVVGFLSTFLPYAALIFIIFFFLGFIFSFVKGKERDNTLLVLLVALVFIFLINQGYDIIQDWLPSGFVSAENFSIIIGLVLIIIIFYVAYQQWGK